MTVKHFLQQLLYYPTGRYSFTALFIASLSIQVLSSCTPAQGPTDEVKRLADSLATAELVDPMVNALELKASQTDNWPGLKQKTKAYQKANEKGTYTVWLLRDSVVKLMDEMKYPHGSYTRYYYLSGSELFLSGYSEYKDTCDDGKPCEWERKYYFEKGRVFKAMARSSSYPDGNRTRLDHLSFNISLENYEDAYKNQHTEANLILNYMSQ